MHLAAKCGHADVALYFVKRGVPIQMPNKVRCLKNQNILSTLLSVVLLSLYNYRTGQLRYMKQLSKDMFMLLGR